MEFRKEEAWEEGRWPEQQELKLSEAFFTAEAAPELELRVKVLNINSGCNEELKEQCCALKEYMQYVTKIRSHAKDMPIGAAVDRAVEECIRQGILRELLLQNKAGVKRMSICEYDEEAVRQALKEDAYEDGKADGRLEGKVEGKIEAVLLLLEISGFLTEELKQKVMSETDDKTLERWMVSAARSKSAGEFMDAVCAGG